MDTPVLKRVERLDSIPLNETYWTEEGYLRDKPLVTSVGIFTYKNKDGTTRRELRLPEHVFDPESLASYRGKPIILTHRAGSVDKDNVEREHIGTILSEGIQDGDDVRVEIIIHDTDAIRESGLRELSLGYSLEFDETPGVWNGQPYDAIQTNIRINHLALVNKARAGEQARLNIDGQDENTEGGTTMDPKDNLTPEKLAEAISLYKARRADSSDPTPEGTPKEGTDGGGQKNTDGGDCKNTDGSDPIQLVKDHRDQRKDGDSKDDKAVIKQMDEDIDSLLKVIEQMKAESDFKAASAAQKDSGDGKEGGGKSTNTDSVDAVDAIVRERVSMLRLCDRLHLDGADSMTIPQIKRAVIQAVRPTMRLDGQSDTYIDVAFDIARNELEARKDTDYQRRQMFHVDGASVKPTEPSGASASREKMIEEMGGGNQS